ncbi:hypothetical protein TGME49_253615 [Toxoplasma gondii ME49]|uniref:Uncharacterized protein n=1 Tax=Toxoplasma gondii (strain ATCC 50611 / Me49) TaxID=508771 RepID=S8FAI4_TOXGM|nr:hypothetical protein TGME49_253615 [Toxoplasma gondii ME49]EPT31797.1 hypothetical protein TGME49_253615 [Toxoplasma gondii ME49]|eukprot:XP_018638175.1 hypothetical protein TGME49_253615 [Toxoplasma gondii ME49]
MLFTTRRPRREEGADRRSPLPVSASSPSPPRPKKRKKEKTRKLFRSPSGRGRRIRSPTDWTREGVEKAKNERAFSSSPSSPAPQSPVLIDLCSDDEGEDVRRPVRSLTPTRGAERSASFSSAFGSTDKTSCEAATPCRVETHSDGDGEDSAAFPAYALSAAEQRAVNRARITSRRAVGTGAGSLSSTVTSFPTLCASGLEPEERSASSSMPHFHQAPGEGCSSAFFACEATSAITEVFQSSEVAEERSEGHPRPNWLMVGRSFDVALLRSSGDCSLSSSAAGASGLGLESGENDAKVVADRSALHREDEGKERRNAEEQSLLEMKLLLGNDEETVKKRSRRQQRADLSAFEDADFDSIMPPPSSIFSAEDFDKLADFLHPTRTAVYSEKGKRPGTERGKGAFFEEPEDGEGVEHRGARQESRLSELEKRDKKKKEGTELLAAGSLEYRQRTGKRGNETDEEEEEGPVLRLFSFTLTDYRGDAESRKKTAKEWKKRGSQQTIEGETKRPTTAARDDGLPFYERIPFVVCRSSVSSSAVLSQLSRASGRPSLRNFFSLSWSPASPAILLPTLRSGGSSERPPPHSLGALDSQWRRLRKQRPAARKAETEIGEDGGAEDAEAPAEMYHVDVTFDVEGTPFSGRDEERRKGEISQVPSSAFSGGEMEAAFQVQQLRQRLHLRCRRMRGDARNWISLVRCEPLFLFFTKARTASLSVEAGKRQLALLGRARQEAPHSLQLLFLFLSLSSLYDQPAHALFIWRRALLQLSAANAQKKPRPFDTSHGDLEGRREATCESHTAQAQGLSPQEGESDSASPVEQRSLVSPDWASTDRWEGRLWVEHFLSAVGIFDHFSFSASRALAGDLVDLLERRGAVSGNVEAGMQRQTEAGAKSKAEMQRNVCTEPGTGNAPAPDCRLQLLLGGLVPCELRGGHQAFAVRLLQAFLHVEVYASRLGPGSRMGLQQLELAFASPHNLHFGDPCSGYLLHSTLQLATMMRGSLSPLEKGADGSEGLRLCEAVDEWVKDERRSLYEAYARAFSFLGEEAQRKTIQAISPRRLRLSGGSSCGGEARASAEGLLTFFLKTQRNPETASLFAWFLAAEEASEALTWWPGNAGTPDEVKDQTEAVQLLPASAERATPQSPLAIPQAPWTSQGAARVASDSELLRRLCVRREEGEEAACQATETAGEEGCKRQNDEARRKRERRYRLLSALDALSSPSLHRFCSNDPRAVRALEAAVDVRLLLTIHLLQDPSKIAAPPATTESPTVSWPEIPGGAPRREDADEPQSGADVHRLEAAASVAGDLKKQDKAKRKRNKEGNPGALFGSWWPDSTFMEDGEAATLAATLTGLWRGVEARLSDTVARMHAKKKDHEGRRRMEEDPANGRECGRQSGGDPEDGGRTKASEAGASAGGREDRDVDASQPQHRLDENTPREGEGQTRAQLVGLLASQALLCLPGDPLVAYCVMAACRNPKVTKTVLRLFPASPGLWLAYASSLFHEAFQQSCGHQHPVSSSSVSSNFSVLSPSSISASRPLAEDCARSRRNGEKEKRCPLSSARNVMFTCCSAFSHHLPLAASWAHLELVSQKVSDVSVPSACGVSPFVSTLSPQEALLLHDVLRAPLDRSLAGLCWLFPALASVSSSTLPRLLPWEGGGLSVWALGVACCAAEENFADLSPLLAAGGPARATDRRAEPVEGDWRPLGRAGERGMRTERSFFARKRLAAAKRKLTEKLNSLATDRTAMILTSEEQEFPLFSSPFYSCVFLLAIVSAALSWASPARAVWRVLRGSAFPRMFSLLPRAESLEDLCVLASEKAGKEAKAEGGQAPHLPFLVAVSERNVTGACRAAAAGPRLCGEEARCLELFFTFMLSLLVALGQQCSRISTFWTRNRGSSCREAECADREAAIKELDDEEGIPREEDVFARVSELALVFFPRNRLFLALYIQHFRRRHSDAFDVRERLLHLLRFPFFGIVSSPWPRMRSAMKQPEGRTSHVSSDRLKGRRSSGPPSVRGNACAPEGAQKERHDGQGDEARHNGGQDKPGVERRQRRVRVGGDDWRESETGQKEGGHKAKTDCMRCEGDQARRTEVKHGLQGRAAREGDEETADDDERESGVPGDEAEDEGCVELKSPFRLEKGALETTAEGAFSMAMLEAFAVAEMLTGAPSLKILTAAFEFAFHDAQLSIAYGACPSRFFSRWSPTSSLATEGIFFLYAHVLLLFLHSLSAGEARFGGQRGPTSQACGPPRARKTRGTGGREETGPQRKRRKALERELDRVLLRGVTQCPYSKRLWLLRLHRLEATRSRRRASDLVDVCSFFCCFPSGNSNDPEEASAVLPVTSPCISSCGGWVTSGGLPTRKGGGAELESEEAPSRSETGGEKQAPARRTGDRGEGEERKTNSREHEQQGLSLPSVSLSSDDEAFLQCVEEMWEKGIALNLDPLFGFI